MIDLFNVDKIEGLILLFKWLEMMNIHGDVKSIKFDNGWFCFSFVSPS